MSVRLSYKGWELRFNEMPTSAQIAAAYDARVERSSIQIPIREATALRRPALPFDAAALSGREVWVDGGPLVAALAAEVEARKGEVRDHPGKELDGLVFDATEVRRIDDLGRVFSAVRDAIPRMRPHGRIVIALPSGPARSAEAAAATAALEGFVRSLPNEIGARASTANMVVGDNAQAMGGPVAFFLSDHSAFVSRQCIRTGAAARAAAERVATVAGGPETLRQAIEARLAAAGWVVAPDARPVGLAVVCGPHAERLLTQLSVDPGAHVVVVESLAVVLGMAAAPLFGAAEAVALAHVHALPHAAVNGVVYGHVGVESGLPAGESCFNALAQEGRPDDVAAVVEFMASGAASFVNRQVLRVCGGYMRGY